MQVPEGLKAGLGNFCDLSAYNLAVSVYEGAGATNEKGEGKRLGFYRVKYIEDQADPPVGTSSLGVHISLLA